jgi:multiple sugar transport system permease protein
MLSIRPDDSWHRIDATLDVGGSRWTSQKTTYLAQHRPISLIFQPPTFDDTTLQPRMWIPMKREARADAGSNRAVLRIILSPSSTPRAVFGKVMRNFQRAFDFGPFWLYVRNSLLLVALTTIGTLFSSAFVAYAFARLHWPGRGVAMLLLLSTMMLPAQVTMIPSFVIWKSLGWYNTLNPMWVPAFFGGAFFIFLMTQQMKTLPRELEESSRIDGLNAVQTWYYIILPQVKPTAAAIAIMTFMWSWNEFMGPLIYLRDQSKFPLSLGLFVMRLENFGDWTMIMAANTLMTLPVIIIFFLCQRYFIQGISMSGMKG